MAHKNLVTVQRPNSPFPLDLTGTGTGTWPGACQFCPAISPKMSSYLSTEVWSFGSDTIGLRALKDGSRGGYLTKMFLILKRELWVCVS